jgi:BlaI family penicillinase repressor
MAAIPQISDAEWEVMKAVWDGAPLTAGEVVERMAGEQQWKPRTIKTLLNRLVKKGAVAMETDGRRYIYRAKVARDAVVRRETRSFLSRVFDGAAAPAIVHFLEHGRLTPEEIQRLRETLDREAKS